MKITNLLSFIMGNIKNMMKDLCVIESMNKYLHMWVNCQPIEMCNFSFQNVCLRILAPEIIVMLII